MDKKKIGVNIIILIFLLFFNLIPVFSIEEKKDSSIKLNELKLTPVITSSAINFINDFFNEKSNDQLFEKHNRQILYLKEINGLIYYTQQENFYPLPVKDKNGNKCTIHQAGCGPTTSAMIIASYIDKSITPEIIVDYFAKKGYYLGCGGSSTYHNKIIIEDFGVKTSKDIINFNRSISDEIFPMLKKYIDAGWTFFVLADFKEENPGGEHFFWVIDIDESGNFWAFDPWYGRYTQPFNENVYYPFPKYMQIFKIRK